MDFFVDSTGITPTDLSYTGIIYYEEKSREDLARFFAVKNLNALQKVFILSTFNCCIIYFHSTLKINIPMMKKVNVLNIALVILLNVLN